jgi:hypothetical protein
MLSFADREKFKTARFLTWKLDCMMSGQAPFDNFEFCKRKRNMRRILTLCAVVAVFTTLALAESWTGKLVDASCAADQQKAATTCDPTSSTTTFALVASGKIFNLDDAGNTKAAEAIKNRADRSTNPNAPQSSTITAKVTGTKDGDNTLKVEAIEVQ